MRGDEGGGGGGLLDGGVGCLGNQTVFTTEVASPSHFYKKPMK